MTLPTITHRAEPVPRHDDPLAQASLCSLCPKLCRPTCPVQAATGRESAAPWRISDAVVRGRSSGWTVELAETVAQCTGCGACGSPCLPGTNLPEESRAARAAAASSGAPLPAAVHVRERIVATGSPRRPSTVGNDVADAPTTLFLGCPARVTDDVGEAALTLFAAAGEPVSCARDERCCGAVAFDLGLVDEATALARACDPSERVVVASPSCARFVREEWPRLGVATPSVATVTEWLATAPLRFAGDPVPWHAPCLDRTPPPVPYAEPPVHRCSGAGTAYPMVDADGARAVADARRNDFDAPPVTSCPSAARALGGVHLLVHLAGRLA